jgi:hypothetical protein
MSIAASANVNMPPGPEPPAAARSFAMMPFEAQRVFSDRQGSEIVDRGLQAAGHRAAIEGDGEPLDAVVGAYPHDHDRSRCIRVFRGIGERIRFWQDEDLRLDVCDFHWNSLALRKMRAAVSAFFRPGEGRNPLLP